MAKAQPVYGERYTRFAETFQATEAELSDCRLVADAGNGDGTIAYATAAGEVLGATLMFLGSVESEQDGVDNRSVPVVNSGLILIDSDGTLAVGDVVALSTDQGKATEGTETGALAVTLNGKDMIVRKVYSGPRAQVQVAV